MSIIIHWMRSVGQGSLRLLLRVGGLISRLTQLALQVNRLALRKFADDDCITLSASIAYFFLFSIIPLLSFSLWLLSGIGAITIPLAEWANTLLDILEQQMMTVFPFFSKTWIKHNLFSGSGLTSFRILTIIALPVIGSLIFSTLEQSYRRIFGLPLRHIVFGRAVSAVITILSILFLFILNLLWRVVRTASYYYLDKLRTSTYLMDLYHLAEKIMPFRALSLPFDLVSLTALIIVYLFALRTFLNIRIHLKYSIPSALLFCGLWFFSRKMFGMYLFHVSKVSLIYGSFSSIIIILTWVFYSAAVLLYSLEVLCILHQSDQINPPTYLPRR